MNYELAKKLKDAGFPQDGVNRSLGFNPITMEPITFPVLSELVDACGEEFGTIFQGFSGHWFAWGKNPTTQDKLCSGKTPEEAVANLWLELNKQDK